MARAIPIGTSKELQVTSTADMGVPHLGPRGQVVSTPAMIQLMEQASLQSIAPYLEENENSVGTKVCVSHTAAARIPSTVTVRSRLTEFTGRRYLFEVEAYNEEGKKMGDGTHERAIINMERFGGA
ncbi:MAG: thioesterase family protein [Dehalococcoidia bacterium]